MKHASLSRLLLWAGAAVAAAAAFVLLVYLPCSSVSIDGSIAAKLGFLLADLGGAFCLFDALFRYGRICRRVGDNRSFCRENVSDMGKIARLMFACGLMSLLMAVPAGFLFGRVWFDCVLACLGCAGLGVIAYALACLLRGAVELQEENELTV